MFEEPSETQGVYLSLINFENILNNLNTEPVIINDMDLKTKEGKEQLNGMIHTAYDGDTLDIMPSCDCGQLKGQYNVGISCTNCGTKVSSITERPLESILWIRVPDGITAFINPTVWSILSNELTNSGFNVLEYCCNPSYPKTDNGTILRKLEKIEFKRSLNWFVENFDYMISNFDRLNLFKRRQKDRGELLKFIAENREAIFTSYIPIPSKLTFIVENAATGSYADGNMKEIIDAIRTITSITTSAIQPTQRVKEMRSVKMISQLATYYKSFIDDSVGSKPGLFRKHVFGSRLHFTFRAVITSLSSNHAYDELHLPWSMSVMVFKTHLTAKLMKLGYSPNDCIEFLYKHTLTYHPLLDELFQELISETCDFNKFFSKWDVPTIPNHPLLEQKPRIGFPVAFNRNPSLQRGSIQSLRVTKVKTDVTDNTVAMSVLVLKSPNADLTKMQVIH